VRSREKLGAGPPSQRGWLLDSRADQTTIALVETAREPGHAEVVSRRARLARSLRLALEDGGVTFIKLGQVLSTRRDLLPAEFISELSRLQDDAPQVPWPRIEEVLRSELGAGVDEVFASFDREPLAAASIAQVHAATLRSGARVVVKVRRPDVTRVVDRDLDIVAPAGGPAAAQHGAGAGRSGPWSCRTGSPTRCARNSTCG
jgi:predicted unusual protein kinase regulating ubiquinone biosynthesis (AarF/ABC1/UbiB family)